MRSLREIFAGDPNVRVCPPESSRESDFNAISQDDIIPPEDAEIVEGLTFELYDVPPTGESGFTHFLDGAQRHWRAGYIGLFPFRMAHTSAALLEREARAVKAPDQDSYLGSLEFFAPADLGGAIPKLAELAFVQTVAATDEESPLAVQLKIIKKIEDRRKEHELALASKFGDGKLLIDGGIGEVMRLLNGPFIVGLVKSHQRQYFRSADRRLAILQMRAGQRSSVFRRPATQKQGKDAYSFYLKCRDSAAQAPTFGLARIEMPATDEYLEKADSIAGWILHERCPMSLPDPRYHVLPYPIHLVERHLKARQPSDAAIRGKIGL
ncbi:hypothetical protein BH11ARM1_BH11ARM1_12250 [soil metagenome]